MERLDESFVFASIRPREPDSHKGSYGHVLLAAGSRRYRGAANLAAEGALRAGAGIVTLAAVEPLGPQRLADALVIAPCTGATLARLAAGLSDTPVALAAKSLLRAGRPVVVAVSTNDGLGASGENIARLMQRKHFYFVPFAQDDPVRKPQSLKADLTLVPETLAAALEGRQAQPVLLQRPPALG